MYCPYCGKKNEDSATYCAECGQFIKEDYNFSEQNQSVNSNSSGDFDNGGGNQNRGVIIAIIVIVAAAVIVILFITNVFPWPFHREGTDAETKTIEESKNEAGDSSAGYSDVIDVPEKVDEEEGKEKVEDTSDVSGETVQEEVIEQADDHEDNVIEQQTTEDVVYDKHGISSTLYEVWDGNSATNPSYAYGLTSNLETGAQMSISDLTDLGDAEVLDKIKDALRVDQSAGYLTGTEAQINSLTLNDIDNEDNGLGLSFIVEGGEIVLLVNDGELLPSGSDFLKVPTKVYISNMSYDEYTADYIFPNSDSKYLTRSDLVGLSKEELRLARNEIFARHGRLYEDEPLNDYFSSKSWYHGKAYEEDFDQSVFNDYEWKNLKLLNDYDAEMGYQNIGELS